MPIYRIFQEKLYFGVYKGLLSNNEHNKQDITSAHSVLQLQNNVALPYTDMHTDRNTCHIQGSDVPLPTQTLYNKYNSGVSLTTESVQSEF